MEKFYVTTDTKGEAAFRLYNAFKEDCEKIGWRYNSTFNPFSREVISGHNCLFFSSEFDVGKGTAQMAISNCSGGAQGFSLDTEYREALAHAEKTYEDFETYIPKKGEYFARVSLRLTEQTWICIADGKHEIDGVGVVAGATPEDHYLSITTSMIRVKPHQYIRPCTREEVAKMDEMLAEQRIVKFDPHTMKFNAILPRLKRGDYFYVETRSGNGWYGIHSGEEKLTSRVISYCLETSNLFLENKSGPQTICSDDEVKTLRLLTSSEADTLRAVLFERGKIFNLSTLKLEDIPKTITDGQLYSKCIFWNDEPGEAIIGVLRAFDPRSECSFSDMSGERYENCIPFESIEQYDELRGDYDAG